MANTLEHNYRLEYTRYQHYFHRIWIMSQKPQTKVTLALLLTIFTIIIFAIFAIKPTLMTVAQLIKKIDEQEEVLSKLKQKAGNLSSAQQQYTLASPQIELLSRVVPETYELQQLIKLIEGTAAFHQIALSGLSFGPVTYQDAAAPDSPGLKTLSVTLESSDDYEKVKAFVNDIANLQRLLIINNLNFDIGDQSTEKSNTSTISFTLTADAVYLPKIFIKETTEVNP